jgi:hypothetical protein
MFQPSQWPGPKIGPEGGWKGTVLAAGAVVGRGLGVSLGLAKPMGVSLGRGVPANNHQEQSLL